jgi:glycosyltransferase involved in cell wall biosynthesis/putative flippase GtrA
MLVKFLIVGLFNTFIGLAIIYLAMYFLHFDEVAANATGYGVGVLLGFVLNKRWTFKNGNLLTTTFLRYILVIAVGYTTNLETVLFFANRLNFDSYLAQAFGILPYTLITYFGSKYYAFRDKKKHANSQGYDEAEPESLTEDNNTLIKGGNIDLNIVIPCYNEQDVLFETASRLESLLDEITEEGLISPKSQVYFVDDGSRDRTWSIIEEMTVTKPFVRGIKLSRNQGHQNALIAGLFSATGEAIISIDADLQDDLGAIRKMLLKYLHGCEIVYGVRRSRSVDTFFKRFTARGYYALLHLMGVDVVIDHADYRLMSRRAIEILKDFTEVNLFLRGIIPQMGLKSSVVYYDRGERFAGESKYPLNKMLELALQGITSFSAVPLRAITSLGLFLSLGSFGVTLWVIWSRFISDAAIPGWASTVLPIYFIGGIQLLCLGVIAEYIAKIYLETKRRPRFVIEKII